MDFGLLLPWGKLGYRMDSGDTGDASGPFGTISYPITDNLNLNINAHMMDLQLATEEEAVNYLFAKLGVEWQVTKSLVTHIAYDYVKPGDEDAKSRILAGINYRFWRAF
jgi:hypothetical protein